MIVLGAVLSAFPWLLPGCLELIGAFQEPLLQEAVRRIPHTVLHGWKGKLPGLLRSYTGTSGAAHSPSTVWGHLCCSNEPPSQGSLQILTCVAGVTQLGSLTTRSELLG